jgi:predicted TIM-barrel fold metal-dependent hydrolase
LYGSVTNQDVADIVSMHPGRFVGVGSIDPSNRRKALRQIDEALALGLKGINLEPGAYPTPLYPTIAASIPSTPTAKTTTFLS